MMTACAVATGLSDGDDHVRGPAACSRERSRQGRGDPRSAASGRGPGTPTGGQEGTAHPAGPGLVGGAAAPVETGRASPDAVAGTPGHGAAVASWPAQEAAR